MKGIQVRIVLAVCAFLCVISAVLFVLLIRFTPLGTTVAEFLLAGQLQKEGYQIIRIQDTARGQLLFVQNQQKGTLWYAAQEDLDNVKAGILHALQKRVAIGGTLAGVFFLFLAFGKGTFRLKVLWERRKRVPAPMVVLPPEPIPPRGKKETVPAPPLRKVGQTKEERWKFLVESLRHEIAQLPMHQQGGWNAELTTLLESADHRPSKARYLLGQVERSTSPTDPRKRRQVLPQLSPAPPPNTAGTDTRGSGKKPPTEVHVPNSWFHNRSLEGVLAGLAREGWEIERGTEHTLARKNGFMMTFPGKKKRQMTPLVLQKKFRAARIGLKATKRILGIP